MRLNLNLNPYPNPICRLPLFVWGWRLQSHRRGSIRWLGSHQGGPPLTLTLTLTLTLIGLIKAVTPQISDSPEDLGVGEFYMDGAPSVCNAPNRNPNPNPHR